MESLKKNTHDTYHGMIKGPDVAHEIREGRAGSLNLKNANLVGADLKNVDLSLADLSGSDLSGADLTGAKLFKANLKGAVLLRAILREAELTGADLSSVNLEEADLSNGGLGMACFKKAKLFNANLFSATLSGTDLEGAELRCSNLQKARLRESILINADLTGADLRGADLSLSTVSGALFTNVDLRDSRLRMLKDFENAQWIGADIRDINFAGAYKIRRFIIDQNYLKEFRDSSRLSSFIYKMWWITSDCGRSVVRWSLWILLLIFLFALIYTYVAIDYGEHQTWFSGIYYSVVTITTLGYGDVLPASFVGQVVAIAEVISGYVMLGGLISIFSNKVARRAE